MLKENSEAKPHSDLQSLHRLGKGGCATVHKARLNNNCKVAIQDLYFPLFLLLSLRSFFLLPFFFFCFIISYHVLPKKRLLQIIEVRRQVDLKRASMEEGDTELAARTQRMEEAMLALLRHPNIIEGRGKVKEAGRDIPSLLLELADMDLFNLQKRAWCVALLS